MRKHAIAVAAFMSFVATSPAIADCTARDVLCEQHKVTQGPEAATRLAGYLGGPLPDGVVVSHLLEGGFQDSFIVVRLEANDPGLQQFVKLLGLTDEQFFTRNDAETAGQVLDGAAEKPDWWDWQTTTDLRVAKTETPALPFLSVGLASKPGVLDRYVIYLWGFET